MGDGCVIEPIGWVPALIPHINLILIMQIWQSHAVGTGVPVSVTSRPVSPSNVVGFTVLDKFPEELEMRIVCQSLDLSGRSDAASFPRDNISK